MTSNYYHNKKEKLTDSNYFWICYNFPWRSTNQIQRPANKISDQQLAPTPMHDKNISNIVTRKIPPQRTPRSKLPHVKISWSRLLPEYSPRGYFHLIVLSLKYCCWDKHKEHFIRSTGLICLSFIVKVSAS